MNSAKHSFITTYTYTGINGNAFAGIPVFSAVTRLDDQQIDYYDSNIKKMIPRQDWMKEFASTELWKEYTEVREKQLEIFQNNIHVLMETVSQSHGLHTHQRRFGCEWDDETGDSQGFDQHGYDGEDFISLDLKNLIYNTSLPQASPIVMKWNNDREQLESLKQYYDYECVYWLKEFLYFSKDTSKKTDPPKVSLLQKNLEEYVKCHVTGFRFRDTSILWRKNGLALSSSLNLNSRAILPNGDGTFQRTVVLNEPPNIWREDQYACVVEHKSLTVPIQNILTEDQIMRNKPGSDAANITYLVSVIIAVIVGLIGLIGLWKHGRKHWKKLKASRKKTTIKVKTNLSQEPAPSHDSLISIPPNESSS